MKHTIFLFILLLAIILTGGCQGQVATPAPEPPATPVATSARPTTTAPPAALATAAATPAPTATRPAPSAGGSIVLGLVGQPPQRLNPITEINTTVRHLAPLLFSSLLRVDPNTAQLQPNLAQGWDYSGDGQQVTFELPANLRWSDGTPLTGAELAESLQATQHPALLSFSGISAVDDRTLRLTFLDIDCSAVTAVGLLPLLPAGQILAPQPDGSGPFMIGDRSGSGRALELVRNPHYHGPAPYLEGLTVRFLEKDEVEIALSEGAAQFDLIGPLRQAVRPASQFEQRSYPAAQMVYVAINAAPRNEASLSPPVRQALQLALDREAILAELLNDDGQRLAGPLLPDHWAANDGLTPPAYAPEQAQTLLAEAGLRDSDGDGWLDQAGERLDLAIRLNGANPLHRRLGWLISSYYRSLGLFSRAESVPPDSLIDDLFTHDFRLAIYDWPILPDPDQRLYWHSDENEEGIGLNFTSYHNARVDRLLARGMSVPGCRPEARAEIYDDVQQILAKERPVDFLLAPNHHLLVKEQLFGLDLGPFAPFTWNAGLWYIGSEE